MKRFFQKLEFVKLRDILSIFVMISAIPGAMILRKRRKHIWLICEDRKEARDNGYWLYRYICKHHPETDVVYAIDPKSVDAKKVNQLGKQVISFGGYTHWKYYMAAEKNISSQKDGKPNAAVCYLLEVYGLWKNKRIFLQHGVIINKLDFLLYENTKMSMFVCSAKAEYEFVRDTFGYPKGTVRYLGLTRFDGLHNIHTDPKQILVMPTWREWIATPSSKSKSLDCMQSFETTQYYKCWMAFLQDKGIHDILAKHDLKIVFFPHRNMQRFLAHFQTSSARIIIADWRRYDVQQLLRESAYLITDYSSIFMDFAYMRKPMLYYQFDYDKFRRGQYQEGYFSYKKDGFGPVCDTLAQVRETLDAAATAGLKNDSKYEERETAFFELYDENNCSRNFEAIKEI